MTFAALPTYRTPRLLLRPLVPDDADALVAGVGNFDVSKWLSVVPYPYTSEDAEFFIEKTLETGAQVWAITQDGGLIGVIGLDPDLGYWLARPHWRHGYAFEAAQAIVAHHFETSEARDLGSGYFEGNAQSGAVLRALGFTSTGRGKRDARALSQEVDAIEMRLTHADWTARRDFTLYTPRLTLRPLIEADAPVLAKLAIPEITRGTCSIVTGWSEEEARDFIRARAWSGIPGFMAAIDRDGQMIGATGFGGTPLSLTYFLHPDHWGQGVVSEAMSAFLPALFERFPINRITAEVFEDNPGSAAILSKLGFIETGRDMAKSQGRLEPEPIITYAVTRETYKVPV